MKRQKGPTERILAVAIAIGGTPIAVILLYASWIDATPWPLLILSPGWFVFFALLWTAAGRRLPRDPYTTWLPCILINGFWLFAFTTPSSPDFGSKLSPHNYLQIYAATAILGGCAGILAGAVHSINAIAADCPRTD